MPHIDRPPPIYAIADADALAPASLAEGVEELAAAGLEWIQVRAKAMPDRLLYDQVERACDQLQGSSVRLWVDDRADLAALFPVAGVHLGQHDLPPVRVRGLVGGTKWIGLSTHNRRQVIAADRDPEVDLIAVGPVFATTGKSDPDPPIGVDGVRAFRALTAKPLVAIGGIDGRNLGRVLDAGADSAAMIGALCRGRIATNAARLLDAVGVSR